MENDNSESESSIEMRNTDIEIGFIYANLDGCDDPENIDTKKQKTIRAQLQEFVLTDEDFEEGGGCKEEFKMYSARIPSNEVRIPFTFYLAIPNPCKELDPDTKLYIFKYELRNKKFLESNGMRFGILENCLFCVDGGVEKESTVKCRAVLFFNDTVLSSVSVIIEKKGEIDALSSILDKIKL